MISRIILFCLIILAAYGIVSCNNAEREKEKIIADKTEHRRIIDRDSMAIINNLRSKYDADILWMKKFGILEIEDRKYKNFYTNEIQDAFLINKPIIMFGGIKDIENYDSELYRITIEMSSFKVQMMAFFSPNLEIKINCSKKLINEMIKMHDEIYIKSSGQNINIALISNISEIVSSVKKDSEGNERKTSVLMGSCEQILIAPQEFAFLRDELFKWK